MKRFVYIIIGLMATLTALAQVQFRTSELQRLATALSLCADSLPEGYSHPTVGHLNLTAHVSNRQVDHLGLQLFSEEMRQQVSTPVFDFLERYFLQLKYPPVVKTASNMLRDDAFHFNVGTLADVDCLLPADNFAYTYDHYRYTAIWSRNGQTLLSVSFPVEYELISGENKVEAENNLMSDIQKATLTKETPDDPKRDDHYISTDFSNRLYYQGGKLLSSIRHPAESVANMMLSTNARGHYDIGMTQISYGFQKRVYQVPVRQWIAFCLQSGCRLYYGVEDIGAEGEVRAVVLAVNEAENYNHVLIVCIPADIIDQQQGTIDARLYPYVPTHNVMNMFASYRKSNPKTFVSR